MSAGLALAALAEQHQVVAGQHGPLELGQHGVVEADDAGEARLAGAQLGQEVFAELLLDGAEAGGRSARSSPTVRGRSKGWVTART